MIVEVRHTYNTLSKEKKKMPVIEVSFVSLTKHH